MRLFRFISFLDGLFPSLKQMFITFRLADKSSSELSAECYGLQKKLGQNLAEVDRTSMELRSTLKYCHFDFYFKIVLVSFCSNPGILFVNLR